MLTVGYSQLIRIIFLVEEVAQDKHRGTFLGCISHELNCSTDIRLLTLWLEVEQLTYDEQDMFASLLWRNELLNLVREEYDTNLIVVLDSRESKRCRNLCNHLTLSLHHSTEVKTA